MVSVTRKVTAIVRHGYFVTFLELQDYVPKKPPMFVDSMLTKLPFDEQFSFSVTSLREWGWEGEGRGDKGSTESP